MAIKRGVTVSLAECLPHPKNYNRHDETQVGQLAKSLEKFGQVAALVLQAGPQAGYGVGPEQFLTIKGHGLAQAARALGWSEIVADVLPPEYPEHLALAYLAADNELARQASPEEAQLAALVAELESQDKALAALAAGGEQRLAELLDSLTAVGSLAASGKVDTAGDLQVKWQTLPRQLWVIPSRTLPGQTHRLLIGDATKPGDVARVLDGARADILITDPPYGVDFEEKENAMRARVRKSAGRKQSAIAGDAGRDYRAFFGAFLQAARLADYNTIYVFMMGIELHKLRLAFDDAGCKFSQYLIWIKNRRVIGRTDYQFQNEFILYGWRGKHKFYGRPGKRGTCIFVDNVFKAVYHPTQKPPALLAQLLAAGTLRGMAALDPFAGAGSLLLACEPLGRRAYMLELAPAYAACILERAVLELGLEPQLEG